MLAGHPKNCSTTHFFSVGGGSICIILARAGALTIGRVLHAIHILPPVFVCSMARQRILSLLRSAARATAQQSAALSEACSLNVRMCAFSSSSGRAAAALAGGCCRVDLMCGSAATAVLESEPDSLWVRAGRRLGAGLWQQQLTLSVCGMRSISIAALQPSDK